MQLYAVQCTMYIKHIYFIHTLYIYPSIRKRPNQEFFAEPNRTFVHMNYDLRSYQLKLIKMLAELANLNHCAVPFLSRATVNLSLYNSSPVMK